MIAEDPLVAWRRTLDRVSLHPAFSSFKMSLDVELDGAHEVSIVCTLITRDANLTPGVLSDPAYDDHAIWVRHRENRRALLDEHERARVVADFVRQSIIHELDECLLIDGSRVWDPHG